MVGNRAPLQHYTIIFYFLLKGSPYTPSYLRKCSWHYSPLVQHRGQEKLHTHYTMTLHSPTRRYIYLLMTSGLRIPQWLYYRREQLGSQICTVLSFFQFNSMALLVQSNPMRIQFPCTWSKSLHGLITGSFFSISLPSYHVLGVVPSWCPKLCGSPPPYLLWVQ